MSKTKIETFNCISLLFVFSVSCLNSQNTDSTTPIQSDSKINSLSSSEYEELVAANGQLQERIEILEENNVNLERSIEEILIALDIAQNSISSLEVDLATNGGINISAMPSFLRGDYYIRNNFDAQLLKPVTWITGKLEIIGFGGSSIDPLNLQGIEKSLILQSNPLLVDLNGFSNLQVVIGTVSIDNNPKLQNVNGLSGLVKVGGISIGESLSLENIDGFGAITEITGGLTIFESPLLENLNSLSQLQKIGSSVYIRDNDGLITLNAFSDITELESITVEDNNLLTSLGLTNLSYVVGQFRFTNNPVLCASLIDSLLAQLATPPNESPTISGNGGC